MEHTDYDVDVPTNDEETDGYLEREEWVEMSYNRSSGTYNKFTAMEIYVLEWLYDTEVYVAEEVCFETECDINGFYIVEM